MFDTVFVLTVATGICFHIARLVAIFNTQRHFETQAASTRHGVYFDGWMALAEIDYAYGVLCGLVVALSTIKFVVLFRHNVKIQRMLNLYHKVVAYVVPLFIQLGIVFVAYAFAGYIAFGASVEAFASLSESLATLFSTVLGVFDFHAWMYGTFYLIFILIYFDTRYFLFPTSTPGCTAPFLFLTTFPFI